MKEAKEKPKLAWLPPTIWLHFQNFDIHQGQDGNQTFALSPHSYWGKEGKDSGGRAPGIFIDISFNQAKTQRGEVVHKLALVLPPKSPIMQYRKMQKERSYIIDAI